MSLNRIPVKFASSKSDQKFNRVHEQGSLTEITVLEVELYYKLVINWCMNSDQTDNMVWLVTAWLHSFCM